MNRSMINSFKLAGLKKSLSHNKSIFISSDLRYIYLTILLTVNMELNEDEIGQLIDNFTIKSIRYNGTNKLMITLK